MSILLLFCLSLLAVGAYAEVGTTLSYDEAIDVIQEDLEGYGGAIDRPLCDRHTCCNMTETNSCGISSMSRDSTTLVLPGGETRCILDSSTPYAFEV